MIIRTHLGAKIVISVPETYKKITVGLSGGADSAILLYLLAKEIKDKNSHCTIDTFTIPRPDNGIRYSPKIAEFINNKLGVNIATPVITGNGDIDHNIVVGEAIKGILSSNQYNKIYIAENKAQENLCSAIPPTRSPHKFAWKNISMPFFNLRKSEIIEIYYVVGIEELLKLSHSCTTNTEGRCGWCYNCVERAQGFAELGKTDPGIL